MYLKEILEEESKHLKIPLQLDSLGIVRFMLNDEHEVHLRDSVDHSHFFLYGKVCTLPEVTDPEHLEICERLLEANLFGESVGDSMMALHRQTNKVVLMMNFDARLITYEIYKEKFQEFLNYLVFWKETIKAKNLPKMNVLELMSQRNIEVFLV